LLPRRRSCSPEEGPTIRAWTLKTSATARITMCLICPHPRLLIAQPATEPSSLGVSRVPSGGVTLKRRCTYRPSVIYLIVNKLLSLSLSLSPTGSVTIKFFIGASPSMPGHREVCVLEQPGFYFGPDLGHAELGESPTEQLVPQSTENSVRLIPDRCAITQARRTAC